MFLPFAFAFLCAAAAGQSTQAQVDSNPFGYCLAWQNAEGTEVAPDERYSIFGITATSNGFAILFWNGDAPQPSLADLMTLSPGDVEAVSWRYMTRDALAAVKLPTVAASQATLIPQPQAGMLAFDSEGGSLIVYTGSAWVTLATA
jgi:hypothetical protein